jgi:hypothetical protein
LGGGGSGGFHVRYDIRISANQVAPKSQLDFPQPDR